MKNLSILLLFTLILAACAGGQNDAPAQGDIRFRTTPPSRLYFKNMRSIRYEATTQPGTRIDLYKLSRFSETRERPILFPIIADNWMQDEAYLLIRPNDYKAGFPDTLQISWRNAQNSGRYTLSSTDRSEQYTFAGQLYRSLRDGHQLSVRVRDGRSAPLFEHKDDRTHFLTTMRDYYRLTER